jgi:hypothetical protein
MDLETGKVGLARVKAELEKAKLERVKLEKMMFANPAGQFYSRPAMNLHLGQVRHYRLLPIYLNFSQDVLLLELHAYKLARDLIRVLACQLTFVIRLRHTRTDNVNKSEIIC